MAEPHVWYHTIDLPDGTSTPGWYDTRPAAGKIEWPAGLFGGRALDVGTFDGFWAFEMERRGAGEVVAHDVDDPEALDWSYDERPTGPDEVRRWHAERGPGFRDAAAARKSAVTRINRSVYDLDPARDGMFDVVVCGSLLLHLRDPVRALERMRGVCRGELVLIETLDPALDTVARWIPAARFSPEWDQWWRVNSAGLRAMTEAAGFEITWTGNRLLIPYGRGAGAAGQYSRINSLAAGTWRERGQLHQALRARPRPPRSRRRA